MIRRQILIEKIIGIVFFIWGTILVSYIIRWISILFKHLTSNFSYLVTLKNYHTTILLYSMTAVGGALLFFNKKTGWLLTLIASASTAFFHFLPDSNSNYTPGYIAFAFSNFLIYAAIFLLLISKSFRLKYQPTNKTWWIVAFSTLLILFDKVIVHSIS